MNKLISRNPILRFKLGRKIVKADLGTALKALDAVGLYTPESKNGIQRTPQITGDYVYTTGGRYGRMATLDEIDKSWGSSRDQIVSKYLNDVTDTVDDKGNLIKKTTTVPKTKKKVSRTNVFPEEVNKNYTHNFLEALRAGYRPNKDGTWKEPLEKKPKEPSQKSSSVSRRSLKTKEQWESLFNNAKNQLSAQQLMYLDSLGIDTSSAEKMQKSINAYNKNSGLVVDNKWGNKSSAALSKILSSMPSNYKNIDTLWGLDNEKNIPDAVPTKPTVNLGYRTFNTYEDNDFSDRLKNMGIRSNADLIDFMHKTNGENYNWNGDNWAKQFRNDVNQALGGDYSDANIRKVFNTQGNWGKGFLGRGDIRDFQNALQINAGIWNGLYDKLLEATDLLSRTGLDGTIYSNSHIKDLFDKVKLNKYTPFMNQFTNVSNTSLGIKTPGQATWRTLLNNRLSYYKLGGQLVSKNPVKRFKLRTKI